MVKPDLEQGRLFNGEPRRRDHPRDPIWDILVDLFYPSGVPTHPKSIRIHLNAIVMGFRSLPGATPKEICQRKIRYENDPKWSTVICTPQALLTHWDQFRERKSARRTWEDKQAAEHEAREREWHVSVAKERQEREIAEVICAERLEDVPIAKAQILRELPKAQVRACAPGRSLEGWLVRKVAERIAPGELERRLAAERRDDDPV